MQLLRSLELEIAVPRKPSMLLMSKEGRELRSATASATAVDLDTVLHLLKEQQDQQHDREFRRQEGIGGPSLSLKKTSYCWKRSSCKVGKALSVFMELNAMEKTRYLEVKNSLLEQLGSTPQQARRSIWLEKPRLDEDPHSFLQRISKALLRIKPLLNSAHCHS